LVRFTGSHLDDRTAWFLQNRDDTDTKSTLWADGGATFAGIVDVTDTTQSTSTTTGAITTDGGLGVVKDAFLGGDVTFGGSLFIGGTGSANELEDYEEGSWTPYIDGSSSYAPITGQTYTTQVGVYTKVGDMVQVNCRVKLLNKATIGGVLRVSGLPFVPVGQPHPVAANSIRYASIADGHEFFAEQSGGNSFLYLFESDISEDEALTQIYTASITDDTEIVLSLTYRTAA
jgi:hypothetical protein